MASLNIDTSSTPVTRKKRLPDGLISVFSDIANGFKITARHGFTLLSVAAIGVTTLILVKPEMAGHLTAASPFATVAVAKGTVANLPAPPAGKLASANMPAENMGQSSYTPATQAPQQADIGAVHALGDFSKKNPAPAATRQQQALVTRWLAKKYRVAGDATDMLVSAAYTTARETKLDPLLILSVMAIESGLNPFAESPVGAQGLMQVMSKIHHEKFQPMGGVKAALNPVANIRVGSLILKDYVNRGGSLEAGLKLYVGAAAFDTDFGYGSKVLAEYKRLKQVAIGKPVPTATAYAAKVKPIQPAVSPPASALAAVEPQITQTTSGSATATSATSATAATSASSITPATTKTPEPAKPEAPVDVPEKVAAL